MKKLFFIAFIFILLLPALAEEYNFTQADVDKFLSFAPAYITLAKTFITNNKDLGLEDFYYSDNDKLMTATEKFLKPYNWTYLKMNDFLYIVRITLDYIGLIDVYGEILGEDSDLLGSDITDAMIALVRKNTDKLDDFFRITDYSATGDITVTDDETAANEYYTDASETPPDTAPPAVTANIAGVWYLESDNAFVWNFKKDGTLSIGQLTPMAADVGGWKGTYTVTNNVVTFKLDKPHPFPNRFTVSGKKLAGDKDALIQK